MGTIALTCLLFIAVQTSSTVQEPTGTQSTATPGDTKPDQQRNAPGVSKDTGATSGDQVTRPAGAKGLTLIGCLSGPDTNGRYILTSMQHRTGVELFGPDELKNARGDKVKLTGTWLAAPSPPVQQTERKPARPFQVTQIEVLSQQCQAPSPTSPGKKK